MVPRRFGIEYHQEKVYVIGRLIAPIYSLRVMIHNIKCIVALIFFLEIIDFFRTIVLIVLIYLKNKSIRSQNEKVFAYTGIYFSIPTTMLYGM